MSDANPYSPPESRTQRRADYRFTSLDSFSEWFSKLLISRAILTILLLALALAVAKYHPHFYATGLTTNTPERVITALHSALQTVRFLVAISTIVLFPIWLYRVSRNTWALGAQNLRFTPRWAVLWLAIPGMNLFKPYQAVREAYQASDPNETATTWRDAPVPEIYSVWWLSWLAAWVSAFVAATNGSLGTQSVSSVLSVVAVLLTVVVVRTMSEQQNRKAESLTGSA